MLRKAFRINGFIALAVILVLIIGSIAVAIAAMFAVADSGDTGPVVVVVLAGFVLFIALMAMTGLTVVDPNEARVVQFFGRYIGSVSEPGFHFVVPLSTRRAITLRVRNFETQRLKVNDADGNPVEIAAVVVYRVVDSYQAAFAVDDYEEYVETQSEAAVRHLATTHPYDAHDAGRTSLRDGARVAEELTEELSERTAMAGIEVIEARITHLAYAPEIAQAMLVRQQAAQVVAARQRIVEGAVGMVGLALDGLRQQGLVELDEERRAVMVSNLLTVLCADRATQPVVNVGSLYS
ncbi:MAG TPA: SPFH domain-containing protein [Gordonia sp. (in: high G+C Gram-positive bacteria)]|uniref:SPFH domain-containing protein n=1 Tax=unclassified Gordonia (in: high G+C Gram-positive bacteria) TaxID=2657482 RepID=UPI000F92A79C|nr:MULTISPECIES: SPFH domain-containing protein [unclassified Gordonia (in: high G+C Gram-positive bacteria)]RUP41176.1 MAG: SPFH domain-containing protein [Gordonia sp. (in: high G+C Gram-positive bacteria)]HNP55634.1 SPFH domain-containing protein [Gordonia sp. (in: high G+C Gram-positive bacteria)]HRC50772.1 SPFH domain-containing protein [Gordonia sp. (in: high G+C Gram-positive bacteria)]